MPVKAGVIRAGARNTRRGAAETFTGVVFQDPVITAESPSRLGGSVVTFTPGARTAWHSHPVGQTLFCLSGVGRICFKGEKPQVLNPGDMVNIPPDTMHWHGAAPDRLFSHLAAPVGPQGPPALRSARLVTLTALRAGPPVDYPEKPSRPSRRHHAADPDRTYRENCQPCLRSIVSGMFPVAH